MRTSEERVAELHRRMCARRAARLRRVSAGVIAACLVLVLLFAVEISRLPVRGTNAAFIGAAASIFTEHAALGFIVVAIVAFCLGAMATALCYRLRAHMADEEKHDDRQY